MIAQYDPLQIQQMLDMIERLETRISELEGMYMATGNRLLFQVGDSSISMNKAGEIIIKARDITLSASGKVNIKAASDLTLKGQKIVEN